MKHYRLAIAVFLLFCAVAAGIVLLAKAISTRSQQQIAQRTPPSPSVPTTAPAPVQALTPTPTPRPEPTPAPVPYVKQIGDTEWRVYVPIEAG